MATTKSQKTKTLPHPQIRLALLEGSAAKISKKVRREVIELLAQILVDAAAEELNDERRLNFLLNCFAARQLSMCGNLHLRRCKVIPRASAASMSL